MEGKVLRQPYDASITFVVSDETMQQPEEAVALFDYTAGTDKELSFNKGDQLLVFSKV